VRISWHSGGSLKRTGCVTIGVSAPSALDSVLEIGLTASLFEL
jgi:hypothetical protein